MTCFLALYQPHKCYKTGPELYASLWFFCALHFNIGGNEKLKMLSSRLKSLIDFMDTSALRVEIIWLSVDVNTINHPGFP